MIRQAISCDICGTEKRQTNHWFVAYEQAGELRVSGWTSRHRLRAESKHLCGQTCLHKLMDEFMAKSIAARTKPILAEDDTEVPAAADTSRTSAAAFEECDEFESSARLIPTPPVRSAAEPLRPQPGVVRMPIQVRTHTPAAVLVAPIPAEPRLSSRSWHAEAWQRERARELREELHAGVSDRRRSEAHRVH